MARWNSVLILFLCGTVRASVLPQEPFQLQGPLDLPDLYEASITELQAGLDAGHFSSVDLVNAYTARIEEVNINGAGLRAVQEMNPSALTQAAALDDERLQKGKRGMLHGIPILLKDNIATIGSEGMNTTAGSHALVGSIVLEDSGVVKRLRKSGAIILGKTSMSEFAGFRQSIGWSGVGGQITNAYYPGGSPCGSSGGSGVASSIGLAAATLGTETDGSISCPSSMNNLVGIKPTVGLTSRAGVIPISSHQDSVGPMSRSVTDSVLVLAVIAGPDPNDNYTLSQPDPLPNYLTALRKDALKGKRIGVPRKIFLDEAGMFPGTAGEYIVRVFEEALQVIRGLGATVVDPANLPSAAAMRESKAEDLASDIEFKIGLNAYLARLGETPTGVRTLSDVIKFNEEHPELELGRDANQTFSDSTNGYNATYYNCLAENRELGRTNGIDAVMEKYTLDALVLPQDLFTSHPSALAGYPIVTVPLGFFPENTTTGPVHSDLTEDGSEERHGLYPAPNLPFGMYFLGSAYSEFELIGMAYAYEQATHTRLVRRAYDKAMPRTQLKDVMGDF